MSKTRFVDPFSPNRPLKDPNYFEGRKGQIDEIVDAFFQTSNENPKHFIITGDRGIGKSSLLLQSKILSEGNNTLSNKFSIDLGVEKFDFVSSWTDVTDNQSLENLSISLLRDLQSTFSKVFSSLKFNIDLGGLLQICQKEDRQKSVSDIVVEFCKQLRPLYDSAIKNNKSGLIIFIDELDRVNTQSGIASFLKLSAEMMNREGMMKIIFAASGITGAVQKLEDEHASIFRTLRDIPLPRFTKNETKLILEGGFKKANHTYDDNIGDLTFVVCGGFPEPIHVLGSEMLSVSEDNHISKLDFESAKIKIVTDVRRNKLADLLSKAGYGKYQLILESMAKYHDVNVPLSYIAKHLKADPNQFSTNIGTLIDKNIINRVDRSVYSFNDPLLKEYIKQFGIIKTDKK